MLKKPRGKPRIRWSPEEDELILRLRNEGKSWEEIVDEINRRKLCPVPRTAAACMMRSSYLRRHKAQGALRLVRQPGGGFSVIIEVGTQRLRFRTQRTFEDLLAFLQEGEASAEAPT